ncbi:hypothetical protein JW916_08100 [Candidatus Sumerlaeota bacterium]|nr:hypothetical protein [Candidatus Sumerlaeota bacterium]
MGNLFEDFSIVRSLVGFVLHLAANSLALWWVVKRVMRHPRASEITYWRCLGCVVMLDVLTLVSAVFLLIPVAGIIVAFIIWIRFGAQGVQNLFGIEDGGIYVCLLYFLVSMGVFGLVRLF